MLDYVWGPAAETAFAALGRRGLDDDAADIDYVQIGSLGGLDARVPGSLLRSRRNRISGSGAGSVSTERMVAELPAMMALIADGTISGGMIPKVETCIYALEQGVEGVVILDGKVPHSVLLELLTDHGAGTLITR